MANELTLTASFRFDKNGAVIAPAPANNRRFTINGDAAITNIQSIGTSNETLQLGDVAAPRFVFLRNLSNAATISIGHTSGTYPLLLPAGGIALLPWNGATHAAIHAVASAAANLEYAIVPA
jgi:hypothetical protein